MGLSLGLTMANVFLSFYELKWLEQCPKEFEPFFFTEDMLMTFLFSSNQLNTSQPFVIILILVIQTSPFALKKDKMERRHFLMLEYLGKKENLH